MTNEENIKPTLKKPMSDQSKRFEKNFNKEMAGSGVKLNEVDKLLTEKEQSLKKKIFNLSKMESLVHADPKLSAVYADMSENGEEKYGYHYNETIMNIIFNEYILNSSKYIQKYKQAIPKKKKRRDKSGINKLKEKGEEKMSKGKPKKKEVDETTGASSSGAYAGPSAWSKTGKSMGKLSKPIFKMGTVVEESVNYLTDPKGFEKYIETLNEEFNNIENMDKDMKNETIKEDHLNDRDAKISYIINAYRELEPEHMDDDGENIIKMVLGNLDNEGIDNMYKNVEEKLIPAVNEESQSMFDENPDSMSLKSNSGSMEIGMGGGMNENMLNKLEKELNAYSIHHDKLKHLTENNDLGDDFNVSGYLTLSNSHGIEVEIHPSGDGLRYRYSNDNIPFEAEIEYDDDGNAFFRTEEGTEYHLNKFMKTNSLFEEKKQSTLVMKDRLGAENKKNFKSDMKNSGTGEIIDIEKELQWKDQQTDVKNPQKLTTELEKNSLKVSDGKAFDNVGNSTNDKGDEVPKRNLTDDETDEVEMYRKGLGDYVYDNKPDKRFEDRMKADMGDKLYKQREKKIKFAADAPMYNKDTQPVDDGIEKVQFDKEKSGWNERKGIKESFIGKYNDISNKKCFIDFKLSDVVNAVNEEHVKDFFILDMDGLGNTINNKYQINEDINDILLKYNFYTDGENVLALSKSKGLNESVENKKEEVSESLNKINHLLNYNPNNYINTKKTKKNRGF